MINRVVFGTPYVSMVAQSSRPPLLVKLGGVLILVISYIWAVKMVQLLVRGRRPRKTKDSKARDAAGGGKDKKIE